METAKIFEDLTKMGIRVKIVENVSNTIQLADTHTDEEIAMIEQYLKENKLDYKLVNPQPEEEVA
ncbi:hypothetical protein DRP04_06380 [Archaeoglobales archaeon]|nr:MAG: hypothetical protein DRP04_06380 [Archaeoglobales archaeon]